MTKKKETLLEAAIEVYAWVTMAGVFLDGLLAHRYQLETVDTLARNLKEELDNGIKAKASKLAKAVKEKHG